MAGCNHAAWAHLSRCQSSYSLVDTHRLQLLVESLPQPHEQTPSLVFLLGQKRKNQSLRYLFPHNNLRRSKEDGLARIHLDNSSATTQHPIFFADADLAARTQERQTSVTCHEETTFPVRWQSSDIRTIGDHVFARVLIASVNMLVVFADDFADLSFVADDLVRWINIGSCCDAPLETRPRLLLVVQGSESVTHAKVRQLYRDLENLTSRRLSNLFSLVSTVYLDSGLSPLATYRRLKEEILRQLDEIRSILIDHRWLFSAFHIASAFNMRLSFAASKVTDTFSLLTHSRKYHKLPSNYAEHIASVVAFGADKVVSYESTTSYIASSIFMNAWPSGCHCKSLYYEMERLANQAVFDPTFVYYAKYSFACQKAFESRYPRSFAEFLVFEVLKRLKHHFQFLVAGKSTAAELHAANIVAKSGKWRMMLSNATCLICLASAPNHPLSCGHSLCDECVSTFGTLCLGDEYGHKVKKCFLCNTDCTLRTRTKPPTCGVRIASFDGGGTRGVIPLEAFRQLQNLLGKDCFIPSFFDIAVGTSSGLNTSYIHLVLLLTASRGIDCADNVSLPMGHRKMQFRV